MVRVRGGARIISHKVVCLLQLQVSCSPKQLLFAIYWRCHILYDGKRVNKDDYVFETCLNFLFTECNHIKKKSASPTCWLMLDLQIRLADAAVM